MARGRILRRHGGFLIGLIIGSLMTYYLFPNDSSKPPASYKDSPSEKIVWQNKSLSSVAEKEEPSSSEEVTWPPQKGINHKNEDKAAASRLTNKIRLLCCVMTSPDGIENKAEHIKATWGHRCNILLFAISKTNGPVANNLSLAIVELNVPEGRANPWAKTKAAVKYINKRHVHTADWFFIADDATFAVVENLRYLLKDHSANDPVYLGRRFKLHGSQGYMSGRAGYVLSRAAVRRFLTVQLKKPDLCPDSESGADDLLMGKCLEKCGVMAMDTRDALGRQRFHPFLPEEQHLVSRDRRKKFWIVNYDYYSTEMGPECCSDYSITFHNLPPYMMYFLDFFLYHMKPYGIDKDCDLLG